MGKGAEDEGRHHNEVKKEERERVFYSLFFLP